MERSTSVAADNISASATPGARSSPRRRRWALRTYLGVLIVLFALVAAGASVFVRVQAYADAERAAHQETSFAVRQASAKIGESIGQLQAAVAKLAATPGIAAAFDQSGQCTLSFAGVGPFTAGHLDIVRADGVVVCSSRPQSVGPAGSGYPGAGWLEQGLSKPLLIAPVDDPPAGAKALVAVSAIFERGVVAGFVDLAPLGPGLLSLYGGHHGLEFLVTTADAKTIISRSINPDVWVAAGLSGTSFARAEGDPDRLDVDGKARFYDTRLAEGVDWRVYAGADKAKALAPAAHLFRQELKVIAVGFVAILLATFLVYRRVTKPIGQLSEAMRSSSGHIGAEPVSVHGPAEVSSLAEDFNSLIASVQRELNERLKAEEARERLQHQLNQSQRLESLGQLAGGIAHDFNNLLGGILSYSKLVQEGIREQMKHKPDDATTLQVLQDVDQIIRATERAAALTHQLLLFGRREISKPQIVDLNSVVTDMENLLQRTISENITLTTELTNPLPAVDIDPGHLEQVMMNLVINARDAMPTGGLIAIQTSDVVVDEAYAAARIALDPGRYVSLVVSDTGSGMPKEVAARAFEPFFTTKPKGEGTGLGLATVYGIVNQAGGHLAIYSEEGIGSTFRAYFPAAEAEVAAAPTPSPAVSTDVKARGETILLVEDEDVVREPTARFLMQNDYHLLVAGGPDKAKSISAEHEGKIHLLLTDVVMPGMSGKDLARQLSTSRPDMRVVYISGYPNDVIVHKGIVDPGVILVEKPFSAEALLTRIREVLDTAAV